MVVEVTEIVNLVAEIKEIVPRPLVAVTDTGLLLIAMPTETLRHLLTIELPPTALVVQIDERNLIVEVDETI